MITAYLIRHIIKLPYIRFFKGIYGYNPNKVSEINGGVILAFSIITFHKEFKNKLEYLVNKRLIFN